MTALLETQITRRRVYWLEQPGGGADMEIAVSRQDVFRLPVWGPRKKNLVDY